jgi:hypothetical protein
MVFHYELLDAHHSQVAFDLYYGSKPEKAMVISKGLVLLLLLPTSSPSYFYSSTSSLTDEGKQLIRKRAPVLFYGLEKLVVIDGPRSVYVDLVEPATQFA